MTGLFSVLGSAETDFTLFFRNLAKVESPSDIEVLRPAFYAEPDAATVSSWLALYLARAKPGRAERMNAVNPKYIFRNYLAVQAIEALEKGDASVLERLMRVLGATVRRATAGRGPCGAAARVGARSRRMFRA